MTKRILIFCAIFIILLTTIGFIGDNILALSATSDGHQLPVIIIGPLFLFMLLINPLIGHFRKTKMLKPAELAVVVCICTCACGIGGRALMEHFPQIVTMPHHWIQTNPGWKEREVIKKFPKDALVDPVPYDEVVTRFITGTDNFQNSSIPWHKRMLNKVTSIPWRQWMPPIKTWMPFIILINIAMTAMAMIVHRQWSMHEHLQYPIATFVSTMVERDEDKLLPKLLTNRMFWIGFTIVFLMRLNNGLCLWFPDVFIPVKLYHPLHAFTEKWPILQRGVDWWDCFYFSFFPLATAIAFFLSSEISFSLGSTLLVGCLLSIPLATYGINMNTDYDIGGFQAWTRAGGYLAYTLLLMYSGRFYYWHLIKEAVYLPKLTKFILKRKLEDSRQIQEEMALEQTNLPANHDQSAINATRILIISFVALCILAIRLGLPYPIAICIVFLMLAIFLIVARISAETGLSFIQPGWQPFGFVIAMFGGYALGPTAIIISAIFCSILCIDQSQSLMPYLVNGLKLGENAKVPPAKLARINLWFYIGGIALCLLFAIIVTYDYGTLTSYDWSFRRLPTIPMRAADPISLKLEAIGTLEASEQLTGFQRILAIRPTDVFYWGIFIGFGGVCLCQFMRMHTTWWILHPVAILCWGTYPLRPYGIPILTGWLIKKMCMRFGGYELVKKLKPAACGIITAEVMGALIFAIIGFIYYFCTGELPKSYRFIPR